MSFNTPVEIDTELSRLYFEEVVARSRRNRIQEAGFRVLAGEASYNPYTEQDALDAEQTLKALIEQILPLEAAYELEPWTRYWHVTNSNGHIHRNQSCTSCFPDTEYAWRTDLSGLTDVEVVEREAYNACSVCMPIAPAEQRAARASYTKAQREAKRAEKAAVKATKDEAKQKRADKHVEKVAKFLCEMTGEPELFEAVAILKRDWSVNGHDGKKGIYEATFEMPSQVGDTLYFLGEINEGAKRSIHQPNEFVMNALREREMI